jgi:hypothetical protein
VSSEPLAETCSRWLVRGGVIGGVSAGYHTGSFDPQLKVNFEKFVSLLKRHAHKMAPQTTYFPQRDPWDIPRRAWRGFLHKMSAFKPFLPWKVTTQLITSNCVASY